MNFDNIVLRISRSKDSIIKIEASGDKKDIESLQDFFNNPSRELWHTLLKSPMFVAVLDLCSFESYRDFCNGYKKNCKITEIYFRRRQHTITICVDQSINVRN
ncbi:MAG: hypothetical protein ABFQ53_00695 [Patescibacteria group bacterium]